MKENLEVMEYLAAAEAGKSFLLLFVISFDNMSSVFYIDVIWQQQNNLYTRSVDFLHWAKKSIAAS